MNVKTLFALGLAASLALTSLSSAAVVVSSTYGTSVSAPGVSNTDLLQTSVSTTAFTGNFAEGGTKVLTDGTGLYDGTTTFIFSRSTVGGNGGGGLTATYNFDLNSAINGYDISAVNIFGGWADDGRDEILVELLYSTVAAPTTFLSLGTYDNNPPATSSKNLWSEVALTDNTGLLATGVAAVKFNFNFYPENGNTGYSELDVLGAATIPEPSTWALLSLCGVAFLARSKFRRSVA